MLAITPLFAVGGGSASAADNQTVNVNVGGGETGYSVNAFLPQDVTIHTGDTVNYKFPWLEPHMVVLDNGVDLNSAEPAVDPSPFTFDGVRKYVYSGVQSGPDAPDFAIKFAKAGTYKITCLIHPGMDGSVKVVDSGDADTAATASARGTAEYTADMAALQAVTASLDKPATVTPQANGTKLYSVVAGGVTPKGDVDLYFPGTLNIKEGDSVVWSSNTTTPHTVTFGTPPQGDPFEIPASKPAATYDGTGFWNSGIMGVNPDDPTAASTFQMTFSKAGTYQYFCILHEPLGMVGTVKVEAAAVATPVATATAVATPTKAPGAPNTGSGSESGSNTGLLLIAAVLGLAAAASGTAIIASRRS
jgi:plastocyanin